MCAWSLIARAALAALTILFAAAATAQQADRPTVLKGKPATRDAPPADAQEAPAAIQVAAGEDLWLVDPAAGDLITCRLLKTSTVGKRVIRCFEERLPARFRASNQAWRQD